MGTDKDTTDPKVHMGRNVMKFRTLKGMKQTTLGQLLGISQQMISHIEQKPLIEVEVLEKIAPLLDVSVKILQEFPEDISNIVIENNTFDMKGGSTVNLLPNSTNENFSNNTYQPLEQIMTFFKEYIECEKKQKEELLNRIKELENLIRSMKE